MIFTTYIAERLTFILSVWLIRLLASIINFGCSYAAAWVNHRRFNLSALCNYIKSVSSQLSIPHLFQIARFNRRYINLTDVAAAQQYYSYQRQITKSLIITCTSVALHLWIVLERIHPCSNYSITHDTLVFSENKQCHMKLLLHNCVKSVYKQQ